MQRNGVVNVAADFLGLKVAEQQIALPRTHADHVRIENVPPVLPDDGPAQARNRPRAWRRSFSSWETSTLDGVRRKTWSATRDIDPPRA